MAKAVLNTVFPGNCTVRTYKARKVYCTYLYCNETVLSVPILQGRCTVRIYIARKLYCKYMYSKDSVPV